MAQFTIHSDKYGEHDIEAENILANDVVFPWEFNPHRVKLWLIGHEFGACCAVWATCENDALDIMLDEGLEHFLVEDPEDDPDGDRYAYLGNASEACDLTYAWIDAITFVPERDWRLMVALAEARGAGESNLGGINEHS